MFAQREEMLEEKEHTVERRLLLLDQFRSGLELRRARGDRVLRHFLENN